MTHPAAKIGGVDETDQAQCQEPFARLMAECSRTSGVFTTSRAGALGVTRPVLQRLTHGGVLVREAQGVYRLAAYVLGFDQRLRIASASHPVVISHQTAAIVWGFDGFDDATVHVTLSRDAHRARPDWVVVHRSRRKLAGETMRRRGVEVTTPARTALDLAGSDVTDQQLRDFLGHCIVGRLLTVRSLERYLARQPARSPGLGRMGRLLAGVCEVDSVAENRLFELLAAAGITRPATQFELRDGGRFVARIDLAWPTQRVALELDGYRYHSDPQSFVSDRERGNRIVTAGWTLLRTTPAAVRDDPQRVVSEVQSALRRAGVAA